MKYCEPEVQVLASRLDKLDEAQNRKWKVAGILLGLFIVSLLLIAAKPADRIDPPVVRARSVEAQDFILKDADGQVRARLSLNPTNKVEINGRIFLLRAPSGPALQFYDDNGNPIWTAPQKPTMMPVR